MEERTEASDLSPFQAHIKEIQDAEMERDIASVTPIVSTVILENLLKLDMAEVKKEMGTVIAELILCDNTEIRRLLQEILRSMLLSNITKE